MILESVITCPHCRTSKAETIPTDACRFFYVCKGCGVELRPKQGDCCVFCSYGSVPSPKAREAPKRRLVSPKVEFEFEYLRKTLPEKARIAIVAAAIPLFQLAISGFRCNAASAGPT